MLHPKATNNIKS